MKSKICCVIGALLFAGTSYANLQSAKPVFKRGNWTVLRDTNPMTDKTDCTGIYKDDLGVQLTSKELYLTIRGGPESVTLRFDDQAPESMRLATDIEKKIDAISISGPQFFKLLGSQRLRMEVMTLVRGISNIDLDVTGIVEAAGNISQGCPDDALQDSPAASKPTLCSDVVLKRLREKKIDESIVSYACSG